MSWLSIPLPNPFKSLQYSDDDDDDQQNEYPQEPHDDAEPHGGEAATLGGVKEDLSAIGLSISRQLRGFGAFLAPPPDEAAHSSSSGGVGGDDGGGGGDKALAGIRNDLAEIGGTFKNSLSLFSSPNKAVSRISELASNFLQFNEGSNIESFDENRADRKYSGYDDDDDGEELEYGEGVTDQVIEFARQISDRPELWLDFPLSLDREFAMSEAQSEHVSIVEQLVPSLADLRNRISSDKSETQFWMIYFILLLPRLNDDYFELLSTPEIVEAREKLLLMLRTKNEENISDNSRSFNSSESGHKDNAAGPERSQFVEEVTTAGSSTAFRNSDRNDSDTTQKLARMDNANVITSTQSNKADTKIDDPDSRRNQSNEAAPLADNSNAGPANKALDNVDHLKRQEEIVPSSSAAPSKRFQSEDDVSFSDLDDEDNDLPGKHSGSDTSQITRNYSTEGSTGWVQLNKNEETGESHQLRGQTRSRDRDSEGEESVDWLTVNDFDS